MRSKFLTTRFSKSSLSKFDDSKLFILIIERNSFFKTGEFISLIFSNIKIKSSADLCMYILDSTGVVTVAGESFGAPGYIRLSYATSDDIIIQATEFHP